MRMTGVFFVMLNSVFLRASLLVSVSFSMDFSKSPGSSQGSSEDMSYFINKALKQFTGHDFRGMDKETANDIIAFALSQINADLHLKGIPSDLDISLVQKRVTQEVLKKGGVFEEPQSVFLDLHGLADMTAMQVDGSVLVDLLTREALKTEDIDEMVPQIVSSLLQKQYIVDPSRPSRSETMAIFVGKHEVELSAYIRGEIEKAAKNANIRMKEYTPEAKEFRRFKAHLQLLLADYDPRRFDHESMDYLANELAVMAISSKMREDDVKGRWAGAEINNDAAIRAAREGLLEIRRQMF